MVVISSACENGWVIVARALCRRSKSLRAHSTTPGSPAVLPPRVPVASLRARCQVYEAWSWMPRRTIPPKPAVSCTARERRSERASSTWPNAVSAREATKRGVPVRGTMSAGATYTGRFPSGASVKRGAPTRLRSRNPAWLVPSARLPSTVSRNSWVSRRSTPSDARHARGASKPSPRSVTARAARTAPGSGAPAATHWSGIAPGSVQYAPQAGVGTPRPLHTTSAADRSSPVPPRACATKALGGWLRNSPAPPRMTRVGGVGMRPRSNGAPPSVQVNPARGLRCHSLGSRSVRRPNAESTAGL